jgi:hypothetical protein
VTAPCLGSRTSDRLAVRNTTFYSVPVAVAAADFPSAVRQRVSSAADFLPADGSHADSLARPAVSVGLVLGAAIQQPLPAMRDPNGIKFSFPFSDALLWIFSASKYRRSLQRHQSGPVGQLGWDLLLLHIPSHI